jgi:hypothetical protein
MSSSPAGWFPQEDGRLRYWDGQAWTEFYAPGNGEAAAANSMPADATPPSTGQAPPVPNDSSGSAARPWFKKKRVLIPCGLLAAIVLVPALSSGGDDTTPVAAGTSQPSSASSAGAAQPTKPAAKPAVKPAAKPSPPAAKPVAPASQLGKTVRDGKFAFTVKSVKCGIAKVGTSEYLQKKAQGQFCAVSMKIENIGDEPQSMFADNQYAFDAKDRKFSADSAASIYDDNSQVLWEEINPGNTVQGKVYFDIPKGAKLTRFELHDSMFSGGVKVRL